MDRDRGGVAPEHAAEMNEVGKADQDAPVLGLFAENPFPRRPPHFIRASFYRYEFAPRGSKDTWQRMRAGQYLRPISLDDPEFGAALSSYGIND